MMRKVLIIPVIFLLSCVGDGPSACQCAEMEKNRIEGKMEVLTKTAEEQDKIQKDWSEKLAPCIKKIEDDKLFEKDVAACVLEILKVEFDKSDEKNQ